MSDFFDKKNLGSIGGGALTTIFVASGALPFVAGAGITYAALSALGVKGNNDDAAKPEEPAA